MAPRTLGTVVVHPLVLLNISEHTTRTAAQSKAGTLTNTPLICGALLGRQTENQSEVFLSFELKFNEQDGQSSTTLYELDDRHYLTRVDQMKQIFPEDEFIGWYVVGSSTRVSPAIAALHQQIMRGHPTALLLVFDAAFETGEGGASLPLAVYETLPPTRVERAKLQHNHGADHDDSTTVVDYYVESASDSGIPLEADTVWASHLVPLRIAIDSGEAERVAIEHVANVSRPTTMEIMLGEEAMVGSRSHGSGGDSSAPAVLTSKMATFLASQRNAIDMLHRDITVLKTYVGEVISGAAPFDPEILQLVQRVLCNRPVVQNDELFDLAMRQEETNFQMTMYLANITSTASVVRNLSHRSNAALSAARNKHQAYVNVNRESGMFEGGMSSMFGGGSRHARQRGFGHFR
ncbi:hypothetical protein IWW38_001349 [Coemansia aciculifera]|uniref:Uncharacterized protein n=1 Tax=Coemansia aciculifera TaxID=417176 RepID=A0ACC1M8I9_9FUNG|nr:hypothetical protein IWW38_001349 [Coemansia aciculifera]